MSKLNKSIILNLSRFRAIRNYQIRTTTKKVIPIYPVAEKLQNKNSVIYDISKIDLENKLDPKGWRRQLLIKPNKQGLSSGYIETGDIVRITYDKSKCSNETFLGYVLGVFKKDLVQDSSILLRNQIGKAFVELRVPIFSPLIESIDILKKAETGDKKRGRNKHYYIRNTKLDVGELESMLRKKK